MSDTAPIQHPSWLTSGDFTAADEPFRLFTAWLTEATASEPRDPTAMTLATVDADGLPNAPAWVLLKGADERGFVFYTNIRKQPKRAGNWVAQSQGRLGLSIGNFPRTGRCACEAMSSEVSRCRGRRLFRLPPETRHKLAPGLASQSARAGKPSRLRRRRSRSTAAKYAIGEVPRPPNWSGYRLVPLAIEFWHERPFRLHDRIAFTRDALGARRGTRRGFIRKLASAH